MGKQPDYIPKIVNGNSGNASNGSWTLTGETKRKDKKSGGKGPKGRG
jgi:hypothetical protein